MNTYVIDSDNHINVYGPGEPAPETDGPERIKSSEDLARLADGWPAARLPEIWNGLPGVTPVKRFKDRQTAIARIWKGLQRLKAGPQRGEVTPEPAEHARGGTPAKTGTRAKNTGKAAKPGRKTRAAAGAGRDGSKTAKVLDLLRQSKGATLKEIMKATGWQPHSVRGFISGALGKRMGLTVESTKRDDGERLYKLTR